MKYLNKLYVEIFNGNLPKYGGHWQFLSRWTNLDYLGIGINNEFYSKHFCTYYDGFHHMITICFIEIAWGGKPYKDTGERLD